MTLTRGSWPGLLGVVGRDVPIANLLLAEIGSAIPVRVKIAVPAPLIAAPVLLPAEMGTVIKVRIQRPVPPIAAAAVSVHFWDLRGVR